MDVFERLRDELSRMEHASLLRRLEITQGIDFSSNDYLGLASDPRMKQAAVEALAQAARVAGTGSRLLSGNDESWMELESGFARFIGAEAALFFNSGYAANLGLLAAVLQQGDTVFSDSANHASLIDGIRLGKAEKIIYPHGDLDFLEVRLRRLRSSGAIFIVTESLFSMEGDRAPLDALAALAEQYGAALIVDEAHATGVFGREGRGLVAESRLTERVFASVHTCGKALAAAGAFVCGSKRLQQFLVSRARTFVFTTALPPYFAAQVAAGVQLAAKADAARAHLRDLSVCLRRQLGEQGFSVPPGDSPIVPVLLGASERALAFAEALCARGFGVRAIRPPTVPEGTSRLRLSLTANLSSDNVRSLAAALAEVQAQVQAEAGQYRVPQQSLP